MAGEWQEKEPRNGDSLVDITDGNSEGLLRQQKDAQNLICPEDLKKAFDVMEYDSVHLQKKEKLRKLLQEEQNEMMKELEFRESKKECGYCVKKTQEAIDREEEIEKEKVIECRKALEKEKIASGKYYTKADELTLRQSQRLQMQEKRNIEKEEKVIDLMWHDMLLQEVKMMKEKEDYDAEVSRQEMKQRRQAYDEQIASANRQRREIIENERENENRRLQKMKEIMENEYYMALKRKKRLAMENKKNFLEGHEMKINRLKHEKDIEKDIDLKCIEVSNEELRREKKNKLEKIRQLQNEKQIFVDNSRVEKSLLEKLSKETESVISEWKREEDNQIYKQLKKLEEENFRSKQEALTEYRRYIDARNKELEKKRQNRVECMEAVRRRALQELQRNMDRANEELRKQLDYRQKLTKQIYDNQRVLESETTENEQKLLPFTRGAITFKDAMMNKLNYSTQRKSHVHPFAKMVSADIQYNNTKFLPTLKKIFYNSNHVP
ncbi:trichohyalin [Aricia agestis]|uniref:trichohyalin n=1 Tax=Aricia agestis TaxID=91739 RepID=UPI001C204DB0|nr:trichohyalin [Aricia agestis]